MLQSIFVIGTSFRQPEFACKEVTSSVKPRRGICAARRAYGTCASKLFCFMTDPVDQAVIKLSVDVLRTCESIGQPSTRHF